MILKATLIEIKYFDIDNYTDCLGNQITLNSNKKYKYL